MLQNAASCAGQVTVGTVKDEALNPAADGCGAHLHALATCDVEDLTGPGTDGLGFFTSILKAVVHS